MASYEILLIVGGELMWVPAEGEGYRATVLDAAARAGVPAPDEATVRYAVARTELVKFTLPDDWDPDD